MLAQLKTKGGRPSIQWEGRNGALQKLGVAFKMGLSDAEAAHFAGIAASSLYNYQRENEGFFEEKQGWKA